jgi:tetraacyldisaccharide 4'-kinase
MTFPHFWLNHSIASNCLRPLAQLYGFAMKLRQQLYRWGRLSSHSVGVPVVVVGNVLLGGVGKTPIVIALVQRLQADGYTVGIVSRGYGRSGKGCTEVTKYSAASEVGDEPVLLHRTTASPVFVAANRVHAACALLEQYPSTNIIVSDDGLQHLALKRDIEIVVFDERGVGNGLLLPAGPLREPWPRRPLCATHLILNNVSRQIGTHAINGKGERMTFNKLRSKTIHALTAIGKPEAFFQMLRDKGLELASTQTYPDHDPLTRCTIPSGDNEVLLCTAKDAVKLWQHHPQVWAMPLLIELNDVFLKIFDASVTSLVSANAVSH